MNFITKLFGGGNIESSTQNNATKMGGSTLQPDAAEKARQARETLLRRLKYLVYEEAEVMYADLSEQEVVDKWRNEQQNTHYDNVALMLLNHDQTSFVVIQRRYECLWAIPGGKPKFTQDNPRMEILKHANDIFYREALAIIPSGGNLWVFRRRVENTTTILIARRADPTNWNTLQNADFKHSEKSNIAAVGLFNITDLAKDHIVEIVMAMRGEQRKYESLKYLKFTRECLKHMGLYKPQPQ